VHLHATLHYSTPWMSGLPLPAHYRQLLYNSTSEMSATSPVAECCGGE